MPDIHKTAWFHALELPRNPEREQGKIHRFYMVPSWLAPSRTRLVKNLIPTSSSRTSGKIEIAPRQRPPARDAFMRDKAPHTALAPSLRSMKPPVRRIGGDKWGSHDRRKPSASQKPWIEERSVVLDRRVGKYSYASARSGYRFDSNFSSSGVEALANQPNLIPERRSGSQSKRLDSAEISTAPSKHTISRNEIRSQHDPLPEFFPLASDTTASPNLNQLPTHFTSPPLMPRLLTSLADVLGPEAHPTPIQALSLKHLFDGSSGKGNPWKQFLLASETGSGKSIAYLLPMIQDLKQSELQSHNSLQDTPTTFQHTLNPRALILAPTHELSRQLAGFAKALLHVVKLRVMCASRANVKNPGKSEGTASKMAEEHETSDGSATANGVGEFDFQKVGKTHPVDIVVGTPTKLLEMVRGRGWDREDVEERDLKNGWDFDEKGRKIRATMRKARRGETEMGVAKVDWVVVDEADILFDPDFQESTRRLLADISTVRGRPVAFSPDWPLTATSQPSSSSSIQYPFNFLLTSATIPASLAAYLEEHHPSLIRLASPNLHHLPKTLQTEYVSWTGGNRNADIERRIKRVWAEDSLMSSAVDGAVRSKVLVFCNKSTKVEELGKYLKERGITNIALTSTSLTRKRGSNRHLEGFLRIPFRHGGEGSTPKLLQVQEVPNVMITTSLLSRGLDFSPAIKHVFIVDEPRNMIDFLHRAGRSGRSGQRGKVVVFGKLKGRGSDNARDMRRKVGALAAH